MQERCMHEQPDIHRHQHLHLEHGEVVEHPLPEGRDVQEADLIGSLLVVPAAITVHAKIVHTTVAHTKVFHTTVLLFPPRLTRRYYTPQQYFAPRFTIPATERNRQQVAKTPTKLFPWSSCSRAATIATAEAYYDTVRDTKQSASSPCALYGAHAIPTVHHSWQKLHHGYKNGTVNSMPSITLSAVGNSYMHKSPERIKHTQVGKTIVRAMWSKSRLYSRQQRQASTHGI